MSGKLITASLGACVEICNELVFLQSVLISNVGHVSLDLRNDLRGKTFSVDVMSLRRVYLLFMFPQTIFSKIYFGPMLILGL